MLAKGKDVKFAAKTESSQDHIVNAIPGVFYAAMRKKNFLLFIMKFSKLSFKETMRLGLLNFVEYL